MDKLRRLRKPSRPLINCTCTCKKLVKAPCKKKRRAKARNKPKKRKRSCPKKPLIHISTPAIISPIEITLMNPPASSPIINPILPSITVLPTVHRYFWAADSEIVLESETLLPVSLFANDAGEPAEQFISFGQSGYTNLYLNGILQESGLYSVSPAALTIRPTGQTILAGTPIIIESVGFAVHISAT